MSAWRSPGLVWDPEPHQDHAPSPGARAGPLEDGELERMVKSHCELDF